MATVFRKSHAGVQAVGAVVGTIDFKMQSVDAADRTIAAGDCQRLCSDPPPAECRPDIQFVNEGIPAVKFEAVSMRHHHVSDRHGILSDDPGGSGGSSVETPERPQSIFRVKGDLFMEIEILHHLDEVGPVRIACPVKVHGICGCAHRMSRICCVTPKDNSCSSVIRHTGVMTDP